MIHFLAYLILPESRKAILDRFPPAYPDVICHHITIEYDVPEDYPLPPTPSNVKIIRLADDGKGVQGLLVEVDGTTQRPDKNQYHITLSIDKSKGRSPVQTNYILNLAEPVQPLEIKVIPRVF